MPTPPSQFFDTSNTRVGGFGALPGTDRRQVRPSNQAFTPWEASIDRAPPPPKADVGALAFGMGNFTQSPEYTAANLPPYNSLPRGGPFGRSMPRCTSTLLETFAAVLIVGGLAYIVCRKH